MDLYGLCDDVNKKNILIYQLEERHGGENVGKNLRLVKMYRTKKMRTTRKRYL